jgi:hypothetical protein
MEEHEWAAFTADQPARDAALSRWLELHSKLTEAERLLFDENWTFDDPWPGLIYRGPTGDGMKVVDVETWAFMRALIRGMGEAGNVKKAPHALQR